ASAARGSASISPTVPTATIWAPSMRTAAGSWTARPVMGETTPFRTRVVIVRVAQPGSASDSALSAPAKQWRSRRRERAVRVGGHISVVDDDGRAVDARRRVHAQEADDVAHLLGREMWQPRGLAVVALERQPDVSMFPSERCVGAAGH